jgi:protein O-GlcNAc transferase
VKLRAALLVAIAGSLGLVGPAFASPAAEAAFSDGQSLMATKNVPDAIAKFEAAVTADPKFASAWYALAVARRKSGQCTGAISAYRRYAALVPEEPEPYYGLGLCLRDTGDRAGAIEALRHYVAAEKRPASQRWVEHARSVLVELGASGGGAATMAPRPAAAPPAASAKPVLPGSSPASPLYSEAESLRDHGRIDEAVAKFRQAIEADPRHMAARAALGELLLKVHRDEEAMSVFRAALDKSASYALAWYELAFLLRAHGRDADAVGAYQHYIKLRPTDPDPYYGMARSLERLGRAGEARKAYADYLEMEKRASEKQWTDAARAALASLDAGK